MKERLTLHLSKARLCSAAVGCTRWACSSLRLRAYLTCWGMALIGFKTGMPQLTRLGLRTTPLGQQPARTKFSGESPAMNRHLGTDISAERPNSQIKSGSGAECLEASNAPLNMQKRASAALSIEPNWLPWPSPEPQAKLPGSGRPLPSIAR